MPLYHYFLVIHVSFLFLFSCKRSFINWLSKNKVNKNKYIDSPPLPPPPPPKKRKKYRLPHTTQDLGLPYCQLWIWNRTVHIFPVKNYLANVCTGLIQIHRWWWHWTKKGIVCSGPLIGINTYRSYNTVLLIIMLLLLLLLLMTM